MDLNDLVARFPRVWHSTFPKGWDGIQKSGLRSTTDLLASAGREGEVKAVRTEPVSVSTPDGEATLRNQVPNRKEPGPPVDGMTVEDWWGLLNGRSYLFTVREDVDAFVDACLENGVAQEVITFDTRRLLSDLEDSIDVATTAAPLYPRTTGPSRGAKAFTPLGDFTGLSTKIKEVSVRTTIPVSDNAVVAVVTREPGAAPLRLFPPRKS